MKAILGKRSQIIPNDLPFLLLPHLYLLSMTSYHISHPFGELGSAVSAVSFSTFHMPPAYSLVEWGDKQKRF